MRADHNSYLIAHIVHDIIKDAVEQSQEKGHGRRSPAVMGFLFEISELLTAAQ